jgi:hypothetical protein
MSKVTRNVLLGQISLFVFLFICFLIIPHFLFEPNEGGVSNYGTYAKTVIPYTLAFGLSGISLLLSAKIISNSLIRYSLYALGSLFIAVLVSTYCYKANSALNNIHDYLSAALLIAELIVGTWFGLFISRNPINIGALSLQYVGFFLGVLNYVGINHKLFIAEVIASLGFSILLIKTVDVTQSK